MKPYRHRNMNKAKMGRKIYYLRCTNKPNIENGATKRSWYVFWKMLQELKLITKKLQYHY